MARILIIDDELSIRKAIALALGEQHDVCEAGSLQAAFEAIRRQEFDLVLTDLFIPLEADGIHVLHFVKEHQPQAFVIIMSGHGSIERAVEAIREGADDFLAKGFTMEELSFRIARMFDQERLRKENRELAEQNARLQRELEGRNRFDQIIGESRTMRSFLGMLSRIADDTDSTVLIEGESGTGKELVARAIHYEGPRKEKPFIVVNCTALPEQLLESELFGHQKGAFTGAERDKTGKCEAANGGTLFLDEIGDISPKVQMELLRFTQSHTFERVGGTSSIGVDVRVIAATNKRLEDEVAAGRFREDLFYRLQVVPLTIPPLRERREDIPLLLDHFVRELASRKGRAIRFSTEALALLERYHWPGNVRELENLVRRLIVVAPGDIIHIVDLPEAMIGQNTKQATDIALHREHLVEACEEFERLFILHHLEKHRWNVTETADAIGERRDTLSKKIKRFGIKSDV